MVKLRGPGASDIMPSTTESLGSWPERKEEGRCWDRRYERGGEDMREVFINEEG